jgi:hypothetical protein
MLVRFFWKDNNMSTKTVTIPNVQLTLEQLIGAVRQLEPEARSKTAQALLDDEMDARFVQLLKRLAKTAFTTTSELLIPDSG